MPRHKPHHGPPHPKHSPPHHRHVPSSAVSAFVDGAKLEQVLAPWVPDAKAREFLVRCMVEEGPAHHRGSNFVLLQLLGEVAKKVGASASTGETVAVPMRLPPHLADDADDSAWPLGLPAAVVERLAARGTRDFDAMVDCVTDGPPQHAVANVVMLNLLQSILEKLEGGGR
jgi:hypothetical protein